MQNPEHQKCSGFSLTQIGTDWCRSVGMRLRPHPDMIRSGSESNTSEDTRAPAADVNVFTFDFDFGVGVTKRDTEIDE